MAISLLSPHDYPLARACFSGQEFHLSVPAVLEGAIAGTVLADNPQEPHSACIQCGYRFVFAGDPQNEAFLNGMAEYFEEHIFGPGGYTGEGFLVYYAPGWETALEMVILRGHKLYPGWRQYYEMRAKPVEWRDNLPPEFTLVQVDQALLDRPEVTGLDALREEMCSERPSVEEFLRHSFGVSLLHNNRLVTWCLSEYNLGDCCEVGIATAQEYRRRGLATLSGLAFVEAARAHGIERIGWHCWTANHGSVNTALRIGFEKVRDYPSYFAPLKE